MRKAISTFFDAECMTGRIICCTIYLLFYDYIYEHFVFELFQYMGLDYVSMTPVEYVLWIILSVTPIFFYQGIKQVSSFFCILLYHFVYIPFVHALFITYGIDPFTQYSYTVVLCLFFSFYFFFEKRFPLFQKLTITPLIPITYVEIVTLLLFAFFIGARASSMHFVNIFTQTDILYDLRSQNSETGQSLAFIQYIQGWLNGAFFPFLLICYLEEKSYMKASCVLGGYLALFMVDMQKITFVMPFALIAFYFLIKTQGVKILNKLHSFLIIVISIISFVLYIVQDDPLLFTIGSIIILRTVCVAGWLSQLYLHFFSTNPYTHYAHVNLVNAVTGGYPYNEPLGMAVAYHTQNANANFFLTDGLAAWGLFGIIIIGCFFFVLMQIINAISFKYETKHLLIAFLPFVGYLLNTSIFTTILSDGLFILFFLLLATENPLLIDSK